MRVAVRIATALFVAVIVAGVLASRWVSRRPAQTKSELDHRVVVSVAGTPEHDAWTGDIRRRLLAADVLGVYHDDDDSLGDDHEYDDLIDPLITWLREGEDAATISVRIAAVLRTDYGLTDATGEHVLGLAQALTADRDARER